MQHQKTKCKLQIKLLNNYYDTCKVHSYEDTVFKFSSVIRFMVLLKSFVLLSLLYYCIMILLLHMIKLYLNWSYIMFSHVNASEDTGHSKVIRSMHFLCGVLPRDLPRPPTIVTTPGNKNVYMTRSLLFKLLKPYHRVIDIYCSIIYDAFLMQWYIRLGYLRSAVIEWLNQ